MFRKSFIDAGCSTEDVEIVFGNLDDIYELSLNLLNSLEDALEMCDEGDQRNDESDAKKDDRSSLNEEDVKPVAPIGLCFEDLALVREGERGGGREGDGENRIRVANAFTGFCYL